MAMVGVAYLEKPTDPICDAQAGWQTGRTNFHRPKPGRLSVLIRAMHKHLTNRK
jgi:hypothetical protein